MRVGSIRRDSMQHVEEDIRLTRVVLAHCVLIERPAPLVAGRACQVDVVDADPKSARDALLVPPPSAFSRRFFPGRPPWLPPEKFWAAEQFILLESTVFILSEL